MKRYKVKQVVSLLKRRGWRLQRMKGDHRQFVNDKHPGTVTISGKDRDTISQEVLNSIWKQAGWK
jgi:predicted RNA binding protein YcfA (HicA-like mRNA interferase family)